MSLTPVTPTVKTLPIHSKAALGQSGKLSTPDVKFGINPFDILEGGQQFYEKNDKIQQLRRKGHIKRWGLYNAVIAFVAGPLGYFAPQLIDTLQDYQDHREKIDLISTIEGDANDPLTWTEDDRVIVDTAKLVQNRDQLTSEKFTQLIDMGWVREVESDNPLSDFGTAILIDDSELSVPLNNNLRNKLEANLIDVVNTPLTKTENFRDALYRAALALVVANFFGVGGFLTYSKVRGKTYEEHIFAQQQAMSKLARRIVADEVKLEPSTIDLERIQKAYSNLDFNYDGENPITVQEWYDSWCIDLAGWVMDSKMGDGISVANKGGVKTVADKITTSVLDLGMGMEEEDHSVFMPVGDKKALAILLFEEAEKITRTILNKYPMETLRDVAGLMVDFEDHLLDEDILALLKGQKTEAEVFALYPKSRIDKVKKNRAKIAEESSNNQGSIGAKNKPKRK